MQPFHHICATLWRERASLAALTNRPHASIALVCNEDGLALCLRYPDAHSLNGWSEYETMPVALADIPDEETLTSWCRQALGELQAKQ